MPLWVKLMLLGIGTLFMTIGGLVGVFGTRQAQAHLALVESLSPLSAAALDDQTTGAPALVEGIISPRNQLVFRNFVAYEREELDVTTDSDGDRSETWRSDGRDTPRLLIETGGVVTIANESYSIARGHEVWYDETKLGFNQRPRDGSERYHGLLSGGPVVAFGSVVDGPEGKELDARSIFAGTLEEYLASQREGVTFFPIFGGIFGGIGFVVAAIGALLFLRR